MVKIKLNFIFLLILNSCFQHSKIDQSIKIFKNIENKIIENSESFYEQVKTIKSNKFVEKIYLKNNKILKKEFYLLDTTILILIIRYNKNCKFEIRNEISKYGKILTNGIVFEGKYYGPWEINDENGQKIYRGFRYRDKHFSDGTYFDKIGRIERCIHYDNKHYFDSLIIKFEKYMNEI